MEIKKIKVSKDGVTKEVNANQEKNFVRAGWVVVKEPTQFANPYKR